MQIKSGDFAIIFGGPERVVACQIPQTEPQNINRQAAANVKSQHLIHNKQGIFDVSTCVGKKYGQKISWDKTTGHWVVVLKPNPEFILKSIRHRTQILYRADVSLLLLLLDARPGKVIVECGTGSGSLTYALANAVAPSGHVYTFDFHSQRSEMASGLFHEAKLNHVISTLERDVHVPGALLVPGIEPHSVDAIFLDVPNSWLALENAVQVLKSMGKLVNFSPCVEQAQKVSQALQELKFKNVRTFETLLKPWGISFDDEMQEFNDIDLDKGAGYIYGNVPSANATGYQLPQVGHTGYLTVATWIC